MKKNKIIIVVLSMLLIFTLSVSMCASSEAKKKKIWFGSYIADKPLKIKYIKGKRKIHLKGWVWTDSYHQHQKKIKAKWYKVTKKCVVLTGDDEETLTEDFTSSHWFEKTGNIGYPAVAIEFNGKKIFRISFYP